MSSCQETTPEPECEDYSHILAPSDIPNNWLISVEEFLARLNEQEECLWFIDEEKASDEFKQNINMVGDALFIEAPCGLYVTIPLEVTFTNNRDSESFLIELVIDKDNANSEIFNPIEFTRPEGLINKDLEGYLDISGSPMEANGKIYGLTFKITDIDENVEFGGIFCDSNLMSE